MRHGGVIYCGHTSQTSNYVVFRSYLKIRNNTTPILFKEKNREDQKNKILTCLTNVLKTYFNILDKKSFMLFNDIV